MTPLRRRRWLGASGFEVLELVVEGEGLVVVEGRYVEVGGERVEVIVLPDARDVEALRRAHDAGHAVLVRATTPEDVVAALARPEVASVLVPPDRRELVELDLVELTYG